MFNRVFQFFYKKQLLFMIISMYLAMLNGGLTTLFALGKLEPFSHHYFNVAIMVVLATLAVIQVIVVAVCSKAIWIRYEPHRRVGIRTVPLRIVLYVLGVVGCVTISMDAALLATETEGSWYTPFMATFVSVVSFAAVSIAIPLRHRWECRTR